NVPQQAWSDEAGLYLEGKLIAPLKAGSQLSASLPPCRGEHIEIELRCQGWVPQKTTSGSSDTRTLGVMAYKVTMRCAGAPAKIFDANNGQWIAPADLGPASE